MAIYHFKLKQISKGKGQSACASASYMAGEPIYCEALGKTFNNTKPEVMYSNILLCENAPEEYKDRETLWNAVEKIEKQKNAQLARSIILALPKELSLEQQTELVNNYVQETFVSKGMCADINIHDKGDGNPHAHFMLTMREIDENGEWKKKRNKSFKLDEEGNRIPIMDKKTGEQKLAAGNRKQWEKNDEPVNNWNKKETLTEWRADWADQQNKYLDKESQVDHRTLEAQGIDREPTRHVGYRKGVKNETRLAENAEIKQANKNRQDIHVVAAMVEETEEEVNQRVRVTTLKGQIENQTITEMEDTENGADEQTGTDRRTRKRDRILPTIDGDDRNTKKIEEIKRRTIAATSSEPIVPIGETETANIASGKTISGFDVGAIVARTIAAKSERDKRDAVQHGLAITGEVARSKQIDRRKLEAELKFGDIGKTVEKDDREYE